MALKRGSGVVAQSQHYVASQLVQQALGSATTTETQEMRMPAMLSSLFSAATSAATTTPPSERKTPGNTSPLKSDAKKLLSAVHEDTEEAPEVKTTPPLKEPAPPVVPPRPSMLSPPSRQEKSKELVSHFKKLLVQGFHLVYHPTTGSSKQRTLRIASLRARYLVFESTSSKKSVQLYVHALRQVKAGISLSDQDDPPLSMSVDPTMAFVLDHGKCTLLFQAETTKTRDLVVAGIRLWMNEHRRQDTAALMTIMAAWERRTKQRAFGRLLYAVKQQQA